MGLTPVGEHRRFTALLFLDRFEVAVESSQLLFLDRFNVAVGGLPYDFGTFADWQVVF